MSEVSYHGDGPLFALLESRARANDPQTSKHAAKKVKAGSIRGTILILLRQNQTNGLTTLETAEKFGQPRDHISPHFKPLERLGLIKRMGITRESPDTKTKSEVWELTSKGHDQILGMSMESCIHDDIHARRLQQLDYKIASLQKERKILLEVMDEERSTN